MADRSFTKDVSGVLASNIISIICYFLISVVLSRLLGPRSYGIVSALIVVPIIIVSLCQMGIRRTALHFIGSRKHDDNEVVSALFTLLFYASILGIVVSMGVFLFLQNPDFSLPMIIIVLAGLPMQLSIIMLGGVFLGKQQFFRVNLLQWLVPFLYLALALLFVGLLHWSIMGALLSLFISTFAGGVYCLKIIRKEYTIHLKLKSTILGKMLKLGALNAISFFIIQMNYRIDVLLLQKLSDASEVGYYSLGVSVAEQLWQLPIAVGTVVMSRAANAVSGFSATKEVAKVLRVSMLIGLIAAIVLLFITPWMLPLIYGKEYARSIDVLQLILPAIFIFFIFRILNGHLAGIGKPTIAILVFLPTLLVNVILNIWWIPMYGCLGSAMASNVSYIGGAIAFLYVYAKTMHIPLKEVLRYRKDDFTFAQKFLKKKTNTSDI
jgi:O-antigen/teichoic acid export membrane protein